MKKGVMRGRDEVRRVRECSPREIKVSDPTYNDEPSLKSSEILKKTIKMSLSLLL